MLVRHLSSRCPLSVIADLRHAFLPTLIAAALATLMEAACLYPCIHTITHIYLHRGARCRSSAYDLSSLALLHACYIYFLSLSLSAKLRLRLHHECIITGLSPSVESYWALNEGSLRWLAMGCSEAYPARTSCLTVSWTTLCLRSDASPPLLQHLRFSAPAINEPLPLGPTRSSCPLLSPLDL